MPNTNPEEKKEFKLQGHRSFQGLPLAIENRVGSVRKGIDKDGKSWRTEMKVPYGYVKGSKGADNEPVDVFVGPHKKAPEAFVVHQRKATGKDYDEDKVMLGFKNLAHAKKTYLEHYNNPKFLGPVKAVSMDRLKALLHAGKRLVKISVATWRGFSDELTKINEARG